MCAVYSVLHSCPSTGVCLRVGSVGFERSTGTVIVNAPIAGPHPKKDDAAVAR